MVVFFAQNQLHRPKAEKQGENFRRRVMAGETRETAEAKKGLKVTFAFDKRVPRKTETMEAEHNQEYSSVSNI